MTELRPAFVRSGDQGDQWKQGYISLDRVTENFQVITTYTNSFGIMLAFSSFVVDVWQQRSYYPLSHNNKYFLSTFISICICVRQVVIEGVRGNGYVGDSAIDDVQLAKGEECLAALKRMMADTVVPGKPPPDTHLPINN